MKKRRINLYLSPEAEGILLQIQREQSMASKCHTIEFLILKERFGEIEAAKKVASLPRQGPRTNAAN